MTRILPLFILVFSFVCTNANAQCTPDPQYTVPGFYPEEGLPDVTFDEPYNEFITMVVPTDTVFPLIGTVIIDSFVVESITGIPDGLTMSCNPVNCVFPGGSSGCVALSGTVTDPNFIGENQLVINLTLYGGLVPVPIPISDFTIFVDNSVGISDPSAVSFKLSQNQPNPFSGNTTISFEADNPGNYSLKVSNMLGMEVEQRQINANAGMNTIDFKGANLPEGFYFYSISNGQDRLTKRMIVSH